MLRSMYTTLDLEIYDLEVTIDGDRQARATMTVHIRGMQEGLNLADVQELNIALEKQEGRWLVIHVTVIEVLSIEDR